MIHKRHVTRNILTFALVIQSCKTKLSQPSLIKEQFAGKYFESDSQWYLENIPLFECSDKKLEEIYYYRWKDYKAHIRNVGHQYVITEFINDIHWEIHPYRTIDAATIFLT